MTTNKTKREKKHLKKDKKHKKDILDHDSTKKKHRRHRRSHRNRNRTVSSWKNHYTYESDNLNPTSISNGFNNKNSLNNGIIVNGLRDFLALKKDKK